MAPDETSPSEWSELPPGDESKTFDGFLAEITSIPIDDGGQQLYAQLVDNATLLPIPPKFGSTRDADAWMEKHGGAPMRGTMSVQWSGTGVFKIDTTP